MSVFVAHTKTCIDEGPTHRCVSIHTEDVRCLSLLEDLARKMEEAFPDSGEGAAPSPPTVVDCEAL